MKMKLIHSLKIWVIIYPAITLFLYLLGAPLAVWPLYQRTLLLTTVLVPIMVFLGLPFINFIIQVFTSKNGKA